MTPKEKAEELFIKCYPIWYENGILAKRKYAKEYAQIVVDEILQANKVWYENSIPYKYWTQVKEEIENL